MYLFIFIVIVMVTYKQNYFILLLSGYTITILYLVSYFIFIIFLDDFPKTEN